jgi:hypothetical protein
MRSALRLLTVALFGIGIFGYISVVGSLIEQSIALPRLFRDIDTRWRYFG